MNNIIFRIIFKEFKRPKCVQKKRIPTVNFYKLFHTSFKLMKLSDIVHK